MQVRSVAAKRANFLLYTKEKKGKGIARATAQANMGRESARRASLVVRHAACPRRVTGGGGNAEDSQGLVTPLSLSVVPNMRGSIR